MKISKFFSLCLLVIFSCDLALKSNSHDSIARINARFLILDDIDAALFEGLSKQDSLIQIQNFINNWATEQLLEDGARTNLDVKQQSEFEILVQQYKSDLYISAYLEALVKKNLDTTITNQELEEVYNQNKELFILKEDLIKLRYINYDKNLPNSNEIKRRFRRYNAEDRTVFDTISLQFNSFFLNDSVWIKSSQVVSKIKPLKKGFNKLLLKKINFIQLKDSIGLYLIEVKDLAEIGSQAPMAYALPTLKQIIINKRKLRLVNQLKREIVEDAIKNKKFEIYD